MKGRDPMTIVSYHAPNTAFLASDPLEHSEPCFVSRTAIMMFK